MNGKTVCYNIGVGQSSQIGVKFVLRNRQGACDRRTE